MACGEGIVATHFLRAGDVLDVELADAIGVEEMRELERGRGGEARPALPEGASVVVGIESEGSVGRIGCVVVARGWRVERELSWGISDG